MFVFEELLRKHCSGIRHEATQQTKSLFSPNLGGDFAPPPSLARVPGGALPVKKAPLCLQWGSCVQITISPWLVQDILADLTLRHDSDLQTGTAANTHSTPTFPHSPSPLIPPFHPKMFTESHQQPFTSWFQRGIRSQAGPCTSGCSRWAARSRSALRSWTGSAWAQQQGCGEFFISFPAV